MSNIFAPTDSNEDMLDSRDLVDRQQEIEDEFNLDYEEYPGPDDFAEHISEHEDGDDDLAAEYMTLYGFNEEGRSTFGAAEWDLGVTLVNDSHFEDYARQLADDLLDVTADAETMGKATGKDDAARNPTAQPGQDPNRGTDAKGQSVQPQTGTAQPGGIAG